jgi:hypothetical protein
MPWPAELPLAHEHTLAVGETPRSIALNDRIVTYTLRRARRRSIGLSIDHRGLRVGAPHRASLTEVESLILRHADWVAKKLDEWQSRPRPAIVKIVHGLQLPMLGQTLEVKLATGNNRTVWNEQPGPVSAASPVLTLFLRSPTDAPRILEKALRERAHHLFGERLRLFADKMEFAAPPLSLSSARTRWGSCSLKTGIRLNWRLIHFSPYIVDYVVIHELAHLREMNHGRRFWAIVAQHCPEYRAICKALNSQAASCPRW